MNEKEVFAVIEERIAQIKQVKDKPIRIAVNGIEGTGKTIFAQNLTEYLNSISISAIQISIDGFHFNKEVRYKKGRDSAKGYYEDSYDEITFVEKVLKSSQSNCPTYTKATHDLETDEYLTLPPTELNNGVVMITDGAYLLKPNYRNHWDIIIYLKTSFEIALNRGVERDKSKLGGVDKTKEKFEKRYHEASKMYLNENNPENLADIVIDNSDFESLVILKK
ncbi:MAG: hypothetical protein OCD76_12980 [Reichenbachiella sp.]